MAAKRALVVDDSKSARTFLAKILEKYAFDVVSVESAEQAIEYLAHHRPDVIFMDHLMPGMDGFQAVQVIKANPRTATIPIMMYTSQEGELYLGQARALGAVGVLPKQIKPADVSKVLYQLHLLPDRRSSEQTTFRPIVRSAVEIDDTAADARHPSFAGTPLLTETALREQVGELRRAFAAALDNQMERLRTDLHALKTDLRAAPQESTIELPARPPARRPLWAGIGTGLAGIIAVASLVIAAQQAERTRVLAGELAALRAALGGAAESGLTASGLHAAASGASSSGEAHRGGDSAANALAAGNAPAGGNAASGDPAQTGSARLASETAVGSALRRSLSARPVVEIVPYGEDPFSGPRLDSMRQLFDRLVAQGFRGTVDVKVFPGRFCLMGDSADGFSLAPDETPYARCDLIGTSIPRDDSGAPRVSVAFADLAAELRSASRGTIDVSVLSGDEKATLVAYPPISDSLTAGEWNRAAGANNRIEIRLR